ncbi:MAG: hypothetical protein L6437_11430 [Kiritimatiellae bacterium]|nr:hypothetical protein [Kiritimatiellia bacterium]
MKKITAAIMWLVIPCAFAWFVWEWGFCRFYVPPEYMAVVTAKTGDSLPPGQILAKKGQKGVQEDVLGEGRHFRNPLLFEWQVLPLATILPGKIGIVTSKVGTELPEGEFLAMPGQKGIWRRVLGPGKYRLNQQGYQVDVIDAISIPMGYVGVVTSLSGEQAPAGGFAARNQKGVCQDILQPGLYYVNPKEFTVDVLEVGVNQVSLLGVKGSEVITKRLIATQNKAADELQRNVLMEQREKREDYIEQSQSLSAASKTLARAPGKPAAAEAGKLKKAGVEPKVRDEKTLQTFALSQFVEFPSKDGFTISLDMTVEFELLPESVAVVFRTYGDLPAVVDKIILPQILSVSRLKGSAYGAKDFIVGEGREKFQNDLTETLANTLKAKSIIIHNALIRHVGVPMQILDPIQQASIAVEQDLTNKEMQNTAKKQAELNTGLGLIEQKREQVVQETEKLKAEIKADQEKQVAETRALASKNVAEIEKDSAAIRAEKVRKLGEADAKVIQLVEGEKASGQLMKAQAFGDAQAYSLWELASGLTDELKITILHAGPGTLWTDLEKAKLGELGGAKLLMEPAKPAK